MKEFWEIDPATLTDDELKLYYKRAWDRAAGNNRPEAIASMLIAEINGRENRRITRLNFWLSGIAVSLAVLSTYLAFKAVEGDKDWQQQELKSFNQIIGILESGKSSSLKRGAVSGKLFR